MLPESVYMESRLILHYMSMNTAQNTFVTFGFIETSNVTIISSSVAGEEIIPYMACHNPFHGNVVLAKRYKLAGSVFIQTKQRPQRT